LQEETKQRTEGFAIGLYHQKLELVMRNGELSWEEVNVGCGGVQGKVRPALRGRSPGPEQPTNNSSIAWRAGSRVGFGMCSVGFGLLLLLDSVMV